MVPAESVAESVGHDSPRGNPVARPLVVDLDGTLVRTDLLIESVLSLLRCQPWRAVLLPLWLCGGKAAFKRGVAMHASLDLTSLPWREDVLEYIRQERATGRPVILATAADRLIAGQVARHLNLFDEVLASDGKVNLAGAAKRDLLVARFGDKGFDYAADGERGDLAVWAASNLAVVVNAPGGIRSLADRRASVARVFADSPRTVADWIRPLRPAHWAKNLLVFVPLLAAHRMDDSALLGKTVLAFIAFGLCASSGYVLNDLIDLEADRHHPRKRFRPFASGSLPLKWALVALPTLLLAAALVATLVAPAFLGMVLAYFALTAAYSLRVKQIAVLDVLFLAGLYTVRMMAGSAATGLWLSHWLLAFSTFLFFSLALVKRYSELVVMRRIDHARARARSYELSDAELLASMGTASGYLAVLVLALYISSERARVLYHWPQVLWCLCPLLLYWTSHIWLTAHRGKMLDDPLVFALRDWTSRILIVLMLLAALIAL